MSAPDEQQYGRSVREQRGHAGQHHGSGKPSPLDERRQRAREAYYDDCQPPRVEGSASALETAIETATRVRITPEVERAMYGPLAAANPGRHHRASRRGLIAAFRAAGFEVEE